MDIGHKGANVGSSKPAPNDWCYTLISINLKNGGKNILSPTFFGHSNKDHLYKLTSSVTVSIVECNDTIINLNRFKRLVNS